MKDYKRAAIILAAGEGSRYEGLDEDTSKCVLKFPLDEKKGSYLTPLTASMNACLSIGIYDFYVVVGDAKGSVIAECDRIHRIYGNDKIKITYVENEHYLEYDAGYSLMLGLQRLSKDKDIKEVYIINGDTLVAPKFLERLVDVPNHALLVRGIDKDDNLDGLTVAYPYAYRDFIGRLITSPIKTDNSQDIHIGYLSCNVFKFLITDSYSSDIPTKYIDSTNGESESDLDSAINYLLDKYAYLLVPVYVHPTEGIYDLDTVDDYNRIKNMLISI